MIKIPYEPITSNFGVRVFVAAPQLLDDGVPEGCLNLLNEYGVLVFPKLLISDQTQVMFSNRLGTMQASKLRSKADTTADNLGIYPVTLDPTRAKFLDYIHSNEHWHMDGTTYAVPSKATSLKCEVPASAGGDTEFANLFAAFADLPESKQAALAPLRVVHSAEAANSKYFNNASEADHQRWRKDGPPREQPLVWKHADGRSSLVIGSSADHIVGMDAAESRSLLDDLLSFCTQPKYCYRHVWQKGDLVIWNNCGLLHRAHHYTAESGRLMHRTTIIGAEAFA